jgi:hypothetical protein
MSICWIFCLLYDLNNLVVIFVRWNEEYKLNCWKVFEELELVIRLQIYNIKNIFEPSVALGKVLGYVWESVLKVELLGWIRKNRLWINRLSFF